jgi:cell division protease FtsH
MDDTPQTLPDKKSRFSRKMWPFLILFGLMFGVQHWMSRPSVEQLPYSAFKAALRQGQIEKVRIGNTLIHGTHLIPGEQALHRSPTEAGALRPVRFLTIRVDDPDLIPDLESHQTPYTGQREGGGFATLLSWLLPVALIVGLGSLLARRMGRPAQGLMSFGKSRAHLYAEAETGVAFADVAGVDEAKEELQEIIDFLRQPQKYTALGGRIPKGVLLMGPPGTGKTLLARAVAGEASVPFFSLCGADFVEMFVGVGAARVRDLFKQAQAKGPAIVFIDELDAVGKARGINPMQQNDEREQTLNQLLAEMDGFDPRKGVIVLAATNRPEVLDPALLRAGRFDRQVVIDRPDLQGRLHILRLHAKSIRGADEIDLDAIAARTPGMVGSDLANVINESALLAARHGQAVVTMDDLHEAIDRILTGPQKKSRVMDPREKKRVAYHESGHALVAELLPTAEPVRKVTMIPHGIAALGYTQPLPTQDRYLYTQEELLDRITVLLGGRAAETLIFQDISTGARDDLQKASELARYMVTALGMSEQLGPYTVEQGSQPMFLPNGDRPPQSYSEATAQTIDREAQGMVEDMAERAQQLLEASQGTLETLAQYLLVHETIDQATLARLLAGLPPTVRREPVALGPMQVWDGLNGSQNQTER